MQAVRRGAGPVFSSRAPSASGERMVEIAKFRKDFLRKREKARRGP